MLDRLKPPAMGLDAVPDWFLQMGAPAFAAPLAILLNQSMSANVVPQLWKYATITPVPKSAVISYPFLLRLYFPELLKDTLYDPLSILHYCIHHRHFVSVTNLRLGSTTAVLVALLHTVGDMLSTNSFVYVIALDFSKAFDSVRHSTLMEKMAQLAMPDQVYNWIRDFSISATTVPSLLGTSLLLWTLQLA